MVEIAHAVKDDWPDIRAELEASGLPVDDIGAEHMLDFFVARTAGGEFAGTIGLQRSGTIGLLRSLVVAVSRRAAGLGCELVAHLEQHAGRVGCTELWLLTIDADQYFLRLGFELASRADAPRAIREAAEFSDLCPASAYLMRKELAALSV